MSINELSLQTLLDIPEWEVFQDQFAALLGTSLAVVDYRGILVSKHSGRTGFCSEVLEDPVMRKRCLRCSALTGMEAAWVDGPIVCSCHCGGVNAAIPIIVRDHFLGTVGFGPVRISKDDTYSPTISRIGEVSSFDPDDLSGRQELLELYSGLPEMRYQQFLGIAETLNAFVRYVINRILKTQARALMYGYKQSTALLPNSEDEFTEEQECYTASMETLLHSARSAGADVDVPVSSPVYPAVAYLETNRHERVTMQDMAKLCHLSVSYFSRVFLRETGENFTDYINRKKVRWAMEELQNSNQNISQICANLGFQDNSYFVKVFKKYTGITPSQNREQKNTR